MTSKVVNFRCVGSEVKNYKFKPGEAVTYPTGMDHCVRPVTKGERKALVIWTKLK